MIGSKTDANMLSLLYKPLCAVILLLGLFGLIWLRSSVVAIAYDLRNLEENKMGSLNDRNILLAERAKLMSIEKIDASFRGSTQENARLAAGENMFSNRVRVIHIKRNTMPGPYRASLAVKNKE
ncbi:MAG: hypothetical protein M0Z67_13205 [Nitrospiraceae bacterium]|nr:hypothetical protein [Nitrospiraceae bacterium]